MTSLSDASLVAVVSHDAGGAEVVSSYVNRNALQCHYHLAGPAVSIFHAKLGPVAIDSLRDCLDKSDWLLCSMGWSEVEWQALKTAREMKRHAVVFLDHWTGYEARFRRRSELVLPDEIWVGDSDAEKIARQVFTDVPVKLVPNPYYEDLRDELKLVPPTAPAVNAGVRILYTCEPTAPLADPEKSSGYTDHAALAYFFECLGQLHEKIEGIRLRPHPAESVGKYAWALQDKSWEVTMSDGRDLLQDICENDWVVGRNSMALVVAIIAGRKAFSCIPPGGKPCSLPCREIIHLGQQQ